MKENEIMNIHAKQCELSKENSMEKKGENPLEMHFPGEVFTPLPCDVLVHFIGVFFFFVRVEKH